MRIDLEQVMARIVSELQGNEQFSHVTGTLTGERRAHRPQIRVDFSFNGEERAYLYHIQREGPLHTIAKSLVDDTIRSVPQRIVAPINGGLQPSDVYYPTAFGFMPTRIAGQPSS